MTTLGWTIRSRFTPYYWTPRFACRRHTPRSFVETLRLDSWTRASVTLVLHAQSTILQRCPVTASTPHTTGVRRFLLHTHTRASAPLFVLELFRFALLPRHTRLPFIHQFLDCWVVVRRMVLFGSPRSTQLISSLPFH